MKKRRTSEAEEKWRGQGVIFPVNFPNTGTPPDRFSTSNNNIVPEKMSLQVFNSLHEPASYYILPTSHHK